MSKTKQTIASIINARIEALAGEKSPQQIAAAAGVASDRVLMLYRMGATRVPLDRVRDLAIALDLDPDWLMRLCVEEWMGPEIAQALQLSYAEGLTENERVWLEVLRHSSGGKVPPVKPEGAAMIWHAFEPRSTQVQ
jgi:hypothetical protein